MSTITQESIELLAGDRANWKTVVFQGYNSAIDTTSQQVWSETAGTTWTGWFSSTTVKVSSTSTDDDVGQTGAIKVQIGGLDANGDEQTEIVTLDGQTEVVTSGSWTAINDVILTEAGSGETNVGKIYVGNGTVVTGVPATKYKVIAAGESICLGGSYTVPTGWVAYSAQLRVVSDANVISTVVLKCSHNGGPGRVTALAIRAGGGLTDTVLPNPASGGTTLFFEGENSAVGSLYVSASLILRKV